MDLILCEVKSELKEPRFNEKLRNHLEVLKPELRWAGLFTEDRVDSVAPRLQPLLQDGISFGVARNGVKKGPCRVLPMLCCPRALKQTPISGGSWEGKSLDSPTNVSILQRDVN